MNKLKSEYFDFKASTGVPPKTIHISNDQLDQLKIEADLLYNASGKYDKFMGMDIRICEFNGPNFST